MISSQAWVLASKSSRRSLTHLIGRPSESASAHTVISSG
jgi:hypothetical protein